jgi:hypothetical protein
MVLELIEPQCSLEPEIYISLFAPVVEVDLESLSGYSHTLRVIQLPSQVGVRVS